MSSISTGYSNFNSNPAASIGNPASFAPAQLKTDTEPSETAKTTARETAAAESRKANPGFTTQTRGNNLNITV